MINVILFGIVTLFIVVYYLGLRHRGVHVWLVSYIKSKLTGRALKSNRTVHVLFCFVDHYEPLVGKADEEAGLQRVQKWLDYYPEIADKYPDADGRRPCHSFFYPEEEYRYEYLQILEKLCNRGYGEVEVHIHHDNDTPEDFVKKMQDFIDVLHKKHGFLPVVDGRPNFGFIHGNWALDNSRKDGKWCGINNEITLLRDIGCYADFTLPSAPSDTQTKTINDIYYATDDPVKPKSHNTGTSLRVGGKVEGDLLIFQGPLTLNWKRRSLGIWPRIENSDVTPSIVPIEERIDLWVNEAIHVKGRPEWVFVKVHTHGAHDINSTYLFEDGGFERLCKHLQMKYNDGENYILHYVSAREAYNIAKAAEDNKSGNPNLYRDYKLPKPG